MNTLNDALGTQQTNRRKLYKELDRLSNQDLVQVSEEAGFRVASMAEQILGERCVMKNYMVPAAEPRLRKEYIKHLDQTYG
jgi:hypothetical protein